MGKINSRTGHITIAVVLLLITAMMLKLIPIHSTSPLMKQSAVLLRAMIHFGILITWGLSVHQRIMQGQIRSYLLSISILMVYWLVIRTMKYLFFIESPYFNNLLWYSYYIPMLLIPLIGLFMALHLGKAGDYRLPKWANFLYIPTFLLIGLVLTNDLHQNVFAFYPGDIWIELDYQYKIGYWLVFAWMLTTAFITLGILILKSRVPRSKRKLWLPLIPLLICFVYGVLYIMRIPFIYAVVNDLTIVFCLLIIGIIESCIRVGLIKSNINYAGLLYASGMAVQIADRDYQVRYRSEMVQPLDEKTMSQAKKESIEIDKDTRLSGVSVTGGHAFWLEDISEINRLLSELKKAGELLAENNELFKAELELKEHQIAVDEKSRLYDKLTREITPQINTLDRLLFTDSSQEIPLRKKLIWLYILGAYIKRRSNLIILCEDGHILLAKELEYCFRESAEAISESGFPCLFNSHCKGSISPKHALLGYDIFEEVIESVLHVLSSLLINLRISEGAIELRMQIDGYSKKLKIKKLDNLPQLVKCNGTITETREDNELNIVLYLPKGGESF